MKRSREKVNEEREKVNAERREKEKVQKELSALKTKFWELLGNIRAIVQAVFNAKWKEFLPKIEKAISRKEKKDIAEEYKESVYRAVLKPIYDLQEEVSDIGREPLRKVNLDTFQKTSQRIGYAVGQIKKATVGTRHEDKFADLTKDNAYDNPFMRFCLEDWFNEEKYKPILETMTAEEEVEYMKTENRVKRAIEYLETCMEAGLIEEDEEMER